MERNSFVFYDSFYKAISRLKPEEQSLCLKALCDYSLQGKLPNTDNPIVTMFFELIKPQIDTNNQRYENGCKGGKKPNHNQTITKMKPNHNQTITKMKPNHNQTITKNNQTETKPKPNDNVNDNDNVNVNDNVNDNVNVNVVKVVPKARFTKPTKEEITDFAITNNLSTDMVDEYFDYYEGNGWKVGRNPMKDWKATYRRWCRNSFKSHKKDEIEEILNAGRDL